jgi:hypothetical protein
MRVILSECGIERADRTAHDPVFSARKEFEQKGTKGTKEEAGVPDVSMMPTNGNVPVATSFPLFPSVQIGSQPAAVPGEFGFSDDRSDSCEAKFASCGRRSDRVIVGRCFMLPGRTDQ